MKKRLTMLVMIASLPMVMMQEEAKASETGVVFKVPVQQLGSPLHMDNSGARGLVSCGISRDGRGISVSRIYDLRYVMRGGTIPVSTTADRPFRKGDKWECRVNFSPVPGNLDRDRSTLKVTGTL